VYQEFEFLDFAVAAKEEKFHPILDVVLQEKVSNAGHYVLVEVLVGECVAGLIEERKRAVSLSDVFSGNRQGQTRCGSRFNQDTRAIMSKNRL